MIVDDIMMLKEKHIKITDSQINELLQDQIKSIHSVKNKQNQHCNEDELKVKSLMSKVTLLKESLQSENQTLECKNQDLSKHLDCIVELEAKKKKLLQDNHTLELQRNKLKTCKRNLQDQELLDQGRRKFLLYKELTRIRWDYAKLKESITGYVSNKRSSYVHYFCYANENVGISNLLWQEIYQSTIVTEEASTYENDNILTE